MSKAVLNISEIRELLPHRFPMLLVDRVLEIGDKELVATKLVSANEPFFQGHFPDFPVMPGVLIVEALAQAAGIWALHTYPEKRSLTPALVGVDKARFRRPVHPGDQLDLRVRIVRQRSNTLRVEGAATVEGETVATVTLTASFLAWGDRE